MPFQLLRQSAVDIIVSIVTNPSTRGVVGIRMVLCMRIVTEARELIVSGAQTHTDFNRAVECRGVTPQGYSEDHPSSGSDRV